MRPQRKPGHLDYFEFKNKHKKPLLHFCLQHKTSEITKDFGGRRESIQKRKHFQILDCKQPKDFGIHVARFPGECFYYLHTKYLEGARSQPVKPLDKRTVPT